MTYKEALAATVGYATYVKKYAHLSEKACRSAMEKPTAPPNPRNLLCDFMPKSRTWNAMPIR